MTCLECGKPMGMLKQHLKTDHDLTPVEYRSRWNLAGHSPLVAANYAARRVVLTSEIGLGCKPRAATSPDKGAPAVSEEVKRDRLGLRFGCAAAGPAGAGAAGVNASPDAS